jgi:hypothetical protein
MRVEEPADVQSADVRRRGGAKRRAGRQHTEEEFACRS